MRVRGDNYVHVIRKNKHYLDERKDQHSGYQVKLPKLHNYRQSHEQYLYNRKNNNGSLPPLYNPTVNYSQKQSPSHNYLQNIYRPTKLRSLNKNLNYGLSGERIMLNRH